MAYRFSIHPHRLHFKRPSGTSRGVLREKPSFFIRLWEADDPTQCGWGECSLIEGLSPDARPELLQIIQRTLEAYVEDPRQDLGLDSWPAVRFALEMAVRDLETSGEFLLFPSEFTTGERAIPINGLIWMGEPDFLDRQIDEKLQGGYNCIKLKIGALDFETEIKLLRQLRNRGGNDLEIRVDANGAFTPEEALGKLEKLADLQVHSIEQPIRPGQWDALARLCEATPLPIALDEELIGCTDPDEQQKLLEQVRPQYLILKPSLLGGFQASERWIQLAETHGIGWWVTSALESNIGLNAIAQWTATLSNPLPQGLGTGSLYTNNIPSPLTIRDSALHYLPNASWDLSQVHG